MIKISPELVRGRQALRTNINHRNEQPSTRRYAYISDFSPNSAGRQSYEGINASRGVPESPMRTCKVWGKCGGTRQKCSVRREKCDLLQSGDFPIKIKKRPTSDGSFSASIWFQTVIRYVSKSSRPNSFISGEFFATRLHYHTKNLDTIQ